MQQKTLHIETGIINAVCVCSSDVYVMEKGCGSNLATLLSICLRAIMCKQ